MFIWRIQSVKFMTIKREWITPLPNVSYNDLALWSFFIYLHMNSCRSSLSIWTQAKPVQHRENHQIKVFKHRQNHRTCTVFNTGKKNTSLIQSSQAKPSDWFSPTQVKISEGSHWRCTHQTAQLSEHRQTKPSDQLHYCKESTNRLG